MGAQCPPPYQSKDKPKSVRPTVRKLLVHTKLDNSTFYSWSMRPFLRRHTHTRHTQKHTRLPAHQSKRPVYVSTILTAGTTYIHAYMLRQGLRRRGEGEVSPCRGRGKSTSISPLAKITALLFRLARSHHHVFVTGIERL